MTTSALLSEKPKSVSLVERHLLPIFFALVLAFTWPFMIWDALASHSILLFRLPIPFLLLQSSVQTVAAAIVARPLIHHHTYHG